jgi:putative ABC transport system permease protein
MEVKDIVNLGTKQLREKKVRTALTIIMVIIGVASIVALTSQTAGAQANIQKTLGSLGPTSIIIMPSGKTVFTTADIANLETIKNVSSVTPVVTGSGTLSVDGQNSSVSIIGVSSSGLTQILGNSSELYQGKIYSDGLTPSAVIGYGIAFSSSTNPDLQTVDTGQTGTLVVSGSGRGSSSSKISIPITGILQSRSSSLIPIDGSVFVSLQFAELILHKTSFNEILVKADSPQQVSALTSQLEIIYGNNARVINTEQLASTITSITSQTSDLFIVIAAISLLVAAIGIMNVMLMSVSERVHDIGILKSIGFESRDVLLIFLFQAVVIGLLGGILGLGTGIITSYALSYSGGLHSSSPSFAGATGSGGRVFVSTSGAARGGFSGGVSSFGGSTGAAASPITPSTTTTVTQPVFTLSVIAEAIVIAVMISIIAGIYPAWRASKMEPIEALRTL